ncbi:MAG TPA: response regulator transcription factor [Bryobacterales bacterium]|nr:response regulator transcription factor [Bryobacterales bacterium]
MIRAAILAASPVLSAGFQSLLRSSSAVEVVGAASDVDAFLQLMEDRQPEVIIADLASYEKAWPQLAAAPFKPAVIALMADDPQPQRTIDALRSGARAVITFDIAPPSLEAVIQAAASGLIVIDPRIVKTLLSGDAGAASQASEEPEPLSEAGGLEPLTSREIEVLNLLGEGLGNKQIAGRLGISEHTVKFHVTSILGKLNAASRTEAVTIGVRRGLILL